MDTSRDGDAVDLGAYLAGLDHDELVALLLDAAAKDAALAHRLSLAAVEDAGDVAGLRHEVDAVLWAGGMLAYGDVFEYGRDAQDLVDALARAADGGYATEAVPIVERAIGRVVRAMEDSDDSSGTLGYLVDQLLEVHATACRRGNPDPERLATWLIQFSLVDQDFFTVDVSAYRGVLGKRGLAVYRAEVDRREAADPFDYRVAQAAERLAVLDRDPEAVVRLFGRNLDSPHGYVRVAEAMLEIRRPDDALEWARRGMDLPATRQSRRLFDIAVIELERRGDTTEAIAVRRRGLSSLPDLQSYQALRTVTQAAGTWPAERPGTLGALKELSPRTYVEALLDDGDVDAAWAAISPEIEADDDLMRRLAPRRADTHPGDVVVHYRRFADRDLAGANRQAYGACARWLVALRDVQERAGRSSDFDDYLRLLREENRRRPAFLDELRRARL